MAVSDKKIAGVLVPLFALRAKSDAGCGDTDALRDFIEWAAGLGFRCVQLLPVNETGADHSPYNAISSVAIDPTTIHLGSLEDLPSEELQTIFEKYSGASLAKGAVDWPKVKILKQAALRRAFENFTAQHWNHQDVRALEFTAFTKAEAEWLDAFALFRVLMDLQGTEQWDAWPVEMQSYPHAKEYCTGDAKIEQATRFVQYIQWIALTQWRDIRRHAETCGVELMGDVPFGVSLNSADVWSERNLFDLEWSGGAPPEPAFAEDEFVRRWGQNWGIPLYHWPAHRTSGFAWWRRRARKISEVFHIFRIDHVLGFYRIYAFPWHPRRNAEFTSLSMDEALSLTHGRLPRFHEYPDDLPQQKAANRAQGEEFLRVLQDEVRTTTLVGEDLGTVPDYVRPSLLSLEIPGFKVPQWETDCGADYPRCSVATYATHDHQPLRSVWTKWMRAIEAALHEPESLATQRDTAWAEARRLARWAGFEVPHILDFEEVHEPLIQGLFRCNSWLTILMITDLLGTSQRFNVPGSVDATNWSARIPLGWQFSFGKKCARISELLNEAGR